MYIHVVAGASRAGAEVAEMIRDAWCIERTGEWEGIV